MHERESEVKPEKEGGRERGSEERRGERELGIKSGCCKKCPT